MGTEKDKLGIAYEKAYGPELGQKKYQENVVSRAEKNKEQPEMEIHALQKDEKKIDSEAVQIDQKKYQENVISMAEPEMEVQAPQKDEKKIDSEAVQIDQQAAPVKETPVTEQAAPTPEKEEKAPSKEPDSKEKDSSPSLFSLFTEMVMGGQDNQKNGGEDELTSLFVMALSAALGLDKFQEKFEEMERELQELRKREQEREMAEAEKAPKTTEKESVTYDTMSAEPEKKVEKAADIQQDPLAVSLEGNVAAPAPDMSKAKVEMKDPLAVSLEGNVAAPAPDKAQVKTPADMAYDKIAQGKEQVTLADLKQAGVNLKADLQPTLKALTKDNPDKLSQLAPKGLGDENAPVSKEFATALITRAQQREAIARHNSLSR